MPEDTLTDACEKLHWAYEKCVLNNTARKWFSMFKEGRQSTSKDGGPWAPVHLQKSMLTHRLLSENIITNTIILIKIKSIHINSKNEMKNKFLIIFLRSSLSKIKCMIIRE